MKIPGKKNIELITEYKFKAEELNNNQTEMQNQMEELQSLREELDRLRKKN